MDFDVAIVGAGLVGASFARALDGAGLRIALVEPGAVPQPAEPWDSRIYAISPGNAAFLSTVGAWQSLDASRVQAVRRMEIFGDAPGAQMSFSAYETGVAELAFIVESGRLQRALWDGLTAQHDVTLFSPARCAALAVEEREATLELEDGERIAAKLVIGADGASSWLRKHAGLTATAAGYGERGVVANFSCERSHHGAAYQWFRSDGVLAYLPLPGARMSMVWSTPDEHAHELLDLRPDALCERVAEAGRGVLGDLEILTPPVAFPLQLLVAERIVAPRIALIGDAAHVVHPLAGQGVNLGFGDGRSLADVLRAREPFRDCGEIALLRRYARSRAEAILAMRRVTDGLQQLFSARGRLISGIRNAGLNLTDRMPVLKNLLVRQALG
ncbi:MAG: UbiH/UbiF family hydroxylase [Betaproteobacteria bacterium]|jgi:ubiquinone biosynthesis UbiH/UbiF/VisC/COQ6 family hydroxylase|nr:UbiH/UbiF family hydroxylase [Betaproteobacteria bacterium]